MRTELYDAQNSMTDRKQHKSKINSRKEENNSKDEGKREESKLHTRGDEECRKTRKNEKSYSVHPKGPFVVLVRDFNSIC